MVATEGKKKKPPTFQYLPESRAKRLRKSWIEDHKIRSKWRAQKKREGLTNQTSRPVENNTSTTAESESDTSPDRPDESSTPPRDKQSLRDLRKTAYTRTQKPDSSSLGGSGRSHSDRGKGATGGQPNMKLRMNALLEQIKRDIS